MLSSLTIRDTAGDTVLSGKVSLVGGLRTTIAATEAKKATWSADLSEAANTGFHWSWYQALKANDDSVYDGIPYLCNLSGVKANSRGVLWFFGGRLFQVVKDTELASSLVVASRGTKDLSDEDFSSVRDCYRILRSWLDALKDNLLVSTDTWTAAPLYPTRPTPAQGLPKAFALFQQYKALVYLWNYLLASSSTALQYMIHPADPSGFIVSIDAQLLNCLTTGGSSRIVFELKAEVSAEQTTDLLFWVRQTVAESTPEGMVCEPVITGSKSGTTATLLMNAVPTGLDALTKYQTQFIFEILPYYDADAGASTLGDSAGYYASRENNNYEEQGTIEWVFTCTMTIDGNPLEPVVKTTKAPYVAAPV